MTDNITVLGIDLGKNWFHLTGLNEHGKSVFRKRVNRQQLAELAVTLPNCIVAMESCPGSQYWGRRFDEAGHDLRIIPAQFVKPFLKSNKNDFNDALAIAEAANRPGMRCVPLKSQEQLELQAIHRVRGRLITERTAIVNQMRALLLENGIVIPVGRKLFSRKFPDILEDAENGLSFGLRALLDRLRERWRRLDVEIDEVTELLTNYAKQSELCKRASTVPGIGPIVSTAMVAAVGNAQAFQRSRDMAAWLGLVPRQYTTGGRPRLGPISKRGNRQLRTLLIQGANALLIHMKRDQSAMGEWLRQLEVRSHRHVAIVALANKIVRICWKVLTSGETYRPYPANV
jgi:transposase